MAGNRSVSQPLPPLTDALELLERAVSYARVSFHAVVPASLGAPTPCSRWDLGRLLVHMEDSLCTLQAAADVGQVAMIPAEPDDPDHPVVSLKWRACALLGAWSAHDGAELVSVAGSPLAAQTLVAAGALEIAVHAWDVARACGSELPIPGALAEALLSLVPHLISELDRGTRFG
ncbi:MAG: TIGR03086 family metal-binding protein, partial [Nocardioidaceae bacterium]